MNIHSSVLKFADDTIELVAKVGTEDKGQRERTEEREVLRGDLSIVCSDGPSLSIRTAWQFGKHYLTWINVLLCIVGLISLRIYMVELGGRPGAAWCLIPVNNWGIGSYLFQARSWVCTLRGGPTQGHLLPSPPSPQNPLPFSSLPLNNYGSRECSAWGSVLKLPQRGLGRSHSR